MTVVRGRDDIDVPLVVRLVAEQFPQWAHLPVRRVARDGWDNCSFRLGEELTVRLPSAASYAEKPEKEHLWLPRLAPHLPLPVPESLALGAPGAGYPWRWSVRRWIDGEDAATARVDDVSGLAAALARFLAALRRVDASGGPPPGPHNFFRGGPPATYDAETRRAIAALGGRVDGPAATDVWEAAVAATWRGPAVWLHGDVAASNLVVRSGRLAGVIDFGGMGVGDPACDLTIAWTFFSGPSRESFRAEVAAGAAEWARARGWAIWKALITAERLIASERATAEAALRVVDDVVAEHRRG